MDELLRIALSNAVAALVLAVAAIFVGLFCRRPALVHGLWLLVLLKLVTPPLVRIPIDWNNGSETTPSPITDLRDEISPLIVPVEAEPSPTMLPVETAPEPLDNPAIDTAPIAVAEALPWPPVLALVWLTGSLLWFALAGWRLRRFRRLLRFARPASPAIQDRARRLAGRLGLARCPRVDLLPGRMAPLLWAVGRTRLLLPADLLTRISDEQLDTLFVHELAHLHRRDHWVRVFEFVVLGLYWWHPVVWYARRELREAEEQCCDAWVVSILPGAGRTYANALMDTLDFLSPTPPALPSLASGLGQMADLKRRLTMILRGTTPRALSWPGCLAVVALGAFCLPLLPGLRGDPPAKDDAKLLDKDDARLEAAQARRKQAEASLREAEAKLKLQKALVDVARAEEEQAKRKAKAEGGNKKIYQIAITVTADTKVNCDEIVEKIKRLLPKDVVGEFVYGGPYTEPQRRNLFAPAPPDARINALEKTLEKVLRELQELRRQTAPRGFRDRSNPNLFQPDLRSPTPRMPPPGSVAPPRPIPAPRPGPRRAAPRPAPPGTVQPPPGVPAAPRAIPAPGNPVPPAAAPPGAVPPPPVGEDPYDAPTVPLEKPQRR